MHLILIIIIIIIIIIITAAAAATCRKKVHSVEMQIHIDLKGKAALDDIVLMGQASTIIKALRLHYSVDRKCILQPKSFLLKSK